MAQRRDSPIGLQLQLLFLEIEGAVVGMVFVPAANDTPAGVSVSTANTLRALGFAKGGGR